MIRYLRSRERDCISVNRHDDKNMLKGSTTSDQEEPPPSLRPIGGLPPPEENPWRNASYILTTLQLMMTLLDLFMESGDVPSIHYTITTFQFIPALFLTLYQAVRIHGLWKNRKDSSAILQVDLHIRKPFFFLLLALLLQTFVVIVSGMWYNIANDTTHFEWAVFAVVLFFSIINPMTYSSVAKVADEASDAVAETKKKVRMGPGAAAVSVFTKHFMREKLLFVLGALAACGQAILTTYQGAIISELTKLVTKMTIDPVTGELKIAATYSQVEYKSVLLVGVWFAANLFRLSFDVISALMFSRLEVWLREAVFEKAITYARNRQDSDTDENIPDPVAEFGARYASDVQGVISIYGTLLRGVIVNVLLIVTSFVFLVLYNYEVAVATLCFLAMAVTSGPTDIARDAARSAQKDATKGLGMLSEGIRSSSDLGATGESLCRKHTEEVMVPMKKSLFAHIFYANSVDAYIHLFSSFLTVIVVITMSTSVYDGEMDSSDFLGVFFVFKQLQKPAMKISSMLKKLIRSSANLERLNKTIFTTSESGD